MEVQDIIPHTRRPSIQISHPAPPPFWPLSPNRQKTRTHNTKRSVHLTSWTKLIHSRWTNAEFLRGDTQWPGSSVCTDSCTVAEPGEPKSKLSSRPNHAYLRCDAVNFYWITCRRTPAGGASLSPRPRLRSGSCTTVIIKRRITAASDNAAYRIFPHSLGHFLTAHPGSASRCCCTAAKNPRLQQLLALHDDRRLGRFVSNRPTTTERGK